MKPSAWDSKVTTWITDVCCLPPAEGGQGRSLREAPGTRELLGTRGTLSPGHRGAATPVSSARRTSPGFLCVQQPPVANLVSMLQERIRGHLLSACRLVTGGCDKTYGECSD